MQITTDGKGTFVKFEETDSTVIITLELRNSKILSVQKNTASDIDNKIMMIQNILWEIDWFFMTR